jgi:glycosyltransferase involved in cell wall biosynthesis
VAPTLASNRLRIVLWGTYDTGKPRTRVLRAALREAAVDVIEVHTAVWSGIEDKSQVTGVWPRLTLLLRWMLAYPWLIVRYLRAPAHDAVVVAYLGHLDILVLWPFARLRGKPIVWDAFLSLYDTVVQDRRLVAPGNPVAWLLRGWEWLACRAADRVVLDTEAHARLFRELYDLPAARTAAVFVGADCDMFAAAPPPASASDETTILFYGQFIPLHGIETIVRAAQASAERPWRWVLIGRGQEEDRIRGLIEAGPTARLEWIPWVPYEDLVSWIAGADICLGIFGDTGKASRVIPNKVFQILCAGRPLVTRDSPAIRELLTEPSPGVYLVRPADPQALIEAVERYRSERHTLVDRPLPLHAGALEHFSLPALGTAWSRIAREAAS